MKNWIFLLLSLTFAFGCSSSSESSENGTLDAEIKAQANAVERLYAQLAQPPQLLKTSGKKPSKVTGEAGTIIFVEPQKLETKDGSPIGDEIVVELVEMTQNGDFFLNRAPTVSNGQLLISGGAYSLNMTSDGKPLRIKEGEALDVEFPKLTDEEMLVFKGGRLQGNHGSFGSPQLNWLPLETNFEAKKLEVPKQPKSNTVSSTTTKSNDVDDLFAYIDDESQPPKNATEEELRVWRQMKAEYEAAMKTYREVQVSNFGLINCDRFWEIPEDEKTVIEVALAPSKLAFFECSAMFADIRSMMHSISWKDEKRETTSNFDGVPIGQKIKLIGVGAIGDQAYLFERDITVTKNLRIEAEFEKTTVENIKKLISSMN